VSLRPALKWSEVVYFDSMKCARWTEIQFCFDSSRSPY